MKSDCYLFDEHDDITERVDLINLIFNPYSQNFIIEALTPLQGKVLEIACGRGLMSLWFAKQINVTSVLGIDTNATAITQATELRQKTQLQNVNFKIHSVYDLDLIEEEFDIIYLRFILIHLTNPMAALREIYNKLKPNGVMICETAIYSHCFSNPKVDSYDQFIKFIMQIFASQGKDCDLGKQIYSLCRNQHFSIETMRLIQPMLSTMQEKKAMFLGLKSTYQFFIENKLATEQELNALELQMSKDYLNTDSIWAAPTLCQVAAKK